VYYDIIVLTDEGKVIKIKGLLIMLISVRFKDEEVNHLRDVDIKKMVKTDNNFLRVEFVLNEEKYSSKINLEDWNSYDVPVATIEY